MMQATMPFFIQDAPKAHDRFSLVKLHNQNIMNTVKFLIVAASPIEAAPQT